MKKIILLSFIFLVGCSDSNIDDLEVYVQATTDKPRGRVKPLPEFKPYSAFAYSASALRSPFESPIAFEESSDRSLDLVDAPDENRSRDPLERYALNELTFVGTLAKDSLQLKALIKTYSGSVHILEEGEYIGKNNGLVVKVTESKVDIVEVVPNGSGGWISRPQAMGIKVSSGVNK